MYTQKHTLGISPRAANVLNKGSTNLTPRLKRRECESILSPEQSKAWQMIFTSECGVTDMLEATFHIVYLFLPGKDKTSPGSQTMLRKLMLNCMLRNLSL